MAHGRIPSVAPGHLYVGETRQKRLGSGSALKISALGRRNKIQQRVRDRLTGIYQANAAKCIGVTY